MEYVEPTASSYSNTPVAQLPCVHIFVVDSTIRAKDLEEAKRSLAEAVHSLPPDDLIGLITFDGVVRVFDMSRQEAGFAQVPLRAAPSALSLFPLVTRVSPAAPPHGHMLLIGARLFQDRGSILFARSDVCSIPAAPAP